MQKEKKGFKEKAEHFLLTNNNILWVMLGGIFLIYSAFLYPDLGGSKYAYQLGDVATRDIKAPQDFFIEDSVATEASRKLAVKSVLTVYDHDAQLETKLIARVHSVFSQFRNHLKEAAESGKEPPPAQAEATLPAASLPPAVKPAHPGKDQFEEKLGIKISRDAFQILEKKEFALELENLICTLLNKIVSNGVVANKELLLREVDKGISLRNLKDKSETITKNLKQFYGLDQAQTMVRIFADPLFQEVDYNSRNIIVDFTQRLIQPNITLNRSESEEREKRAEAQISPVLYKIKAGEMILREGERVTRNQLLKLKSLENQRGKSQIFLKSIGAGFILICTLVTVYFLELKPKNEIRPDKNKNMFFLAGLLIVFLFITKISLSVPEMISASLSFHIPENAVYLGMPVAAGAMTVCLFMGMEAAIPFSIIFSVLTAIIFFSRLDMFIYIFLSSTMAAYWTHDCRERKVFIKAGTKIGLLNVALATAISIHLAELSLDALVWSWFFAFSGGMGAGIAAAGIAPLVEMLFNYTTNIKLLEMANLEQPILRRLMIEAPGTYNHSVIVGTMADAVASEIGANPLLARVCGYYHDIGKIEKAQYFIENQADGKNRHDKLAPSMSALILTGHIKAGVEIAKQHKLGQAIIDTITQHHGTSLIEYFYEKAKTQKIDSEETVNPNDFRYPGPKPQTVEAAIVMIADVVEAASRTLDDPTPARIQGLVQNLINKIFADGQLDYCDITLKDLHKIAKSFNQFLSGIHHHRIKYPEKGTSNGKSKNGDTDRQQAAESDHQHGDDVLKRESHLKRLGIT